MAKREHLFLGIDVSGKSTEEFRHIVEALKINELSEESVKKLMEFPKEMRQNWIDNPDSTGELTDDIVNRLHSALDKTPVSVQEEKVDERKIYSPAYAEEISKLDKKAYDMACGSYESSMDRQAAHYDNFYDMMKASTAFPVNAKELDLLCEQVATGNYEWHRNQFVSKEIAKNGGKFTIVQPEGVTDDIGRRLGKRVSDIECVVGDELGLEESKGQNIFIMPSTPVTNPFEKSSFAVYYTGDMSNAEREIKKAIVDELSSAGYDASAFEIGPVHPAIKGELETVQKADLTTPYIVPQHMSPEAMAELRHAETVMNHGFDEDGYNEDGFDETGHSRDGDYNPMYDKAYTDQGPDFD